MKLKVLMIGLLLSTVILISAFEKPKDKVYPVKLTPVEWQIKLNVMDATIKAIRSSDMPSRMANELVDSITSFQREITTQVQLGMKQDTIPNR